MPGVALGKADLVEIGLSETKAAETLRNATLSASLLDIITQARGECGGRSIGADKGKLLYAIATRLKSQCLPYRPRLVTAVANEEISNEAQLTGALTFLLGASVKGGDLNEAQFRDASGIGHQVTIDQIEDTVKASVAKFADQIKAERYRFNVGKLMGDVKSALKWADGGLVKKEIDMAILLLIGPKTPEELAGIHAAPAPSEDKKGKGKSEKEARREEGAEEGASSIEDLMLNLVKFHKPGDNYKTEGYQLTPNTHAHMAAHLKRTAGKVITRFPPEPNGVLHIGHAKAINIDFGYAKAHGGECNLRYDDTNPEKEEEKFFTAIRDIVEWLGYKPARVTHSSDNFQQLYEWALKLIKDGKAYVCHQRAEEMRGFNPVPSPWRNRPIRESLQLFEDMRKGKIDEGAATLRMKLVLEEGKLDPVAYRIKFVPHHRTGTQWCIYPTYDYTHCLCDSIEDVTHSLCTKEFQSRRSSYYWLCNAVDVYCPVQWEYGRLNINYTVVSKRKIAKLISEGIVKDWDDPRLFTLTALRRRGIPAEAINSFVAQMGMSMAQTAIDPVNLDAHVRDHLNNTAPRAMGVLEPLKVEVENWGEGQWAGEVEVPDFPAAPDRGSHKVPTGPTFFIDADDFSQGEGEKGFKRLTEKQSVGLKYLSAVISITAVKRVPPHNPLQLTHCAHGQDGAGKVVGLKVRIAGLTAENKPKAFIQWIANPLSVHIRLYDRLFYHKNPEDESVVPGGFVTDCNMDSLRVVSGMVDRSVAGAQVYDHFQLERIGFFSVDPDSTPQQIVLNRTVLLKEDSGKKN